MSVTFKIETTRVRNVITLVLWFWMMRMEMLMSLLLMMIVVMVKIIKCVMEVLQFQTEFRKLNKISAFSLNLQLQSNKMNAKDTNEWEDSKTMEYTNSKKKGGWRERRKVDESRVIWSPDEETDDEDEKEDEARAKALVLLVAVAVVEEDTGAGCGKGRPAFCANIKKI